MDLHVSLLSARWTSRKGTGAFVRSGRRRRFMACGHAWQAIHHIETRAHTMLSKEAWVKRSGMSRVTVSAVHPTLP